MKAATIIVNLKNEHGTLKCSVRDAVVSVTLIHYCIYLLSNRDISQNVDDYTWLKSLRKHSEDKMEL